jgi:hypothetical protein
MASGPFTITATATDSDGGVSAPATIPVTVNNVPPVISGLGVNGVQNATINEGETADLTGAVLFQGTQDGFSLQVNWGDGTTPDTFTFDPGTTMFDVVHTYASNPPGMASGPFTITATATDSDGSVSAPATIAVTVNNVPPVLTGLAVNGVQNATINEGDTADLTGAVLFQGTQDGFSLQVNWGDGTTPDTFTFDPGTTMFDVVHTYADNPPGMASGPFTISVTATDTDGGASAPATIPVTVANVAPVVSGLAVNGVQNATVPEGSTVTLTGSVLDQGVLDSQTVTVNWGDGATASTVNLAAGETMFSATHTYNNTPTSGTTFTINVTATDKDGGTGSASTAVTVTAVTPVVTLSGAATVQVGATYTLGLSATNVGPNPITSTTITWGDGVVQPVAGLPATVTHIFTSAGARTISATFTTQDGTFPAANTVTVNVTGSTASLTQRFIIQAYRDVLGREVDAPSLAQLTVLLDSGQVTRMDVALSLTLSTEYRVVTIGKLYNQLLHRPVDQPGLNSALQFLATGSTFDQLRAILIGSDEYFVTRGGGTVSGFLNAMFQDVLGRPIDAPTQAAATQALAAGVSRNALALTVVLSTEAHVRLVNNLYQTYLRRQADSAGLVNSVVALQAGTREEFIIAILVGSPEYLAMV